MKQFCAYLAALLITIGGFTGCGQTDQSSSAKPDNDPTAQLSGQQILERMASAYASAGSYTDKAVLYLTYRMPDGSPMQEPMPWSVNFEKNSGRFDGRLYDTVVKYDGTRLSCQVFEIKSDNLDNQLLLIDGDRLPMDQMLRDPIAHYMVGGFSELPLREGSDALVQSFLPPTIQLLSGQVDFPWISQPENVQRLEDQLIEGVVCFHVLTQFKNQPCEMWIEQETGLIHQILFPPYVFEADKKMSLIRDLKIVARFHQCKFDQNIESENFRITPPIGASLVTQFVTLPAPFPSELIGKTAPAFTLHTTDGTQVSNKTFAGKPTALLWIAGFDAEEGIKQFDHIKKQFGDTTNLAVVYSDAEMQDASGTNYQMKEDFIAKLRPDNLQVPFLCDHRLDVWSLLQIKDLPSVIIFDENMRIQYAKALSGPNLPAGLENAIIRVSKGDDLAQEVIDQYGQYHTNYQAALRKFQYDTHRHSVAAQNASTQIHGSEKANDLWTNDALLQPGNLVAASIAGRTRIAVLDGYRTVVILDESGKQILRKQLEIPENQAVTRLRVATSGNQLVFAAFSKLGSQVHWFDENLKPIGRFPQSVNQNARIEDCDFIETNNSTHLVVAVKDAGLHQVDLATSESKKITDISANEVCASATSIAGVQSGLPFCSTLPDLSPELFRGWHFSDLSSNPKTSDNEEQFCALVTTEKGRWQAIGLDSDFKIRWKIDSGEMEFENDIEPLVAAPDHQAWLVADSDNGISVVTKDGRVDYQKRVDSNLQGLTVVPAGRRLRIVYTAGNEIKCCEINMGN